MRKRKKRRARREKEGNQQVLRGEQRKATLESVSLCTLESDVHVWRTDGWNLGNREDKGLAGNKVRYRHADGFNQELTGLKESPRHLHFPACSVFFALSSGSLH